VQIAEIGLNPAGVSAAFAAGVISFASPCVWPLVPAYLSYISGVTFGELDQQTRRVVISTVAFVLGFTIVFTMIGAGAGVLGATITGNRRALEIGAGAIVIVMGALLAGFGGRLLLQERRLHVAQRRGLVGAFVAGLAFAIGWTPCIGPTLGAIVTFAARTGSALDSSILLAAYSLGLGVPFLLSGLAAVRGASRVGVLRRNSPMLMRGSGVVLMALGVMLLTGELNRLTSSLSTVFVVG
jgi:cytochrome c-type biogenesis protein